MFINLNTAEILISVVTLVIGYVATVSIAGFCRAWIALKLGDTTAQQYGFLTLNPFVHIDPIGMICFVIFKFGWGGPVPINYSNITNPLCSIKQVIAFFSRALSHIIMAICATTILVCLLDSKIIMLIRYVVFHRNMISHLVLTQVYTSHSSFIISISVILFICTYLNIILGAFHTIVDGWDWVIYKITEVSPYSVIVTNDFVRFFTPIALFIFFSKFLCALIINLVEYFSFLLTHIACLV